MRETTPEFVDAVRAARVPVAVEAGGITRLVTDVSGIPGAERIPRALVVLLENVVRRARNDEEAVAYASEVISAGLAGEKGGEVEFMPARVLFQDFTGVPVFVDFAAMRDAMVAHGGDPARVNPHIPCTLVIDHSVAADCVGSESAACENRRIEAERNRERFAFLKWASRSFDNVRIVPPGGGICHQLNVERFCDVSTVDALAKKPADFETACFDTLVGTDSHTTTANGLGVLGWGVGGIEAEAAALGQPITMLVPQVIGLRLTGELPCDASGMDVALTVAQLLRAEGVVGCFVEAFGPGVATLSATQRSCVANMTPEYGSTCTLFPADDVALDYLSLVGRDPSEVAFTREFLRVQGISGDSERTYAKVLDLDLSDVRPCLAGPSRPHDRLEPAGLRERFRAAAAAHGNDDLTRVAEVTCADGSTHGLGHGTIAIAAVTSCTTATDPAMMVAAGLLAKAASERGLAPKSWVKRVLAPGSHATELLLERAGLLDSLRDVGFYTCGFGCMSCIGNSGPILDCLKPYAADLELTSVLSGNRNFEGRISPDVAQNYLCQPALVVAYSLVGTMDVDPSSEPVGIGRDGRPVMLDEIMPSRDQIDAVLSSVLDPELFEKGSEGLDGDAEWAAIDAGESATFDWDPDSTYVRRPPSSRLPNAPTPSRSRVPAPSSVSATSSRPTTSRPQAPSPTTPPRRATFWRGAFARLTSTPMAAVAATTRSWPVAPLPTSAWTTPWLRVVLAVGPETFRTRSRVSSTHPEHYAQQDIPLVVVAGQDVAEAAPRATGRARVRCCWACVPSSRRARAHPPLQPHRHGHPAPGVLRRSDRRDPGPRRDRDLRHRAGRPFRRAPCEPHLRRACDPCRWHGRELRVHSSC